MPSRNTIRIDTGDSYYHVYARGSNKMLIFREDNDKDYFLSLLARYLSVKPAVSKDGTPYPHYRERIELLCYCLMDNHFHLLFYQNEKGELSNFMKSLMTSYTAYFNRKYKRTGPLFESRFKAALITVDSHLAHISRYIHLNPRSWRRYPYSSYYIIIKRREPEWLQPNKILEDYDSVEEYEEFVADYEDKKAMLATIKHDLANM